MNQLSKPAAVVFDLDGLMFNTEELYQQAGGQILARRGKSFDRELLDAMMGCPADVALKRMIEWHDLDDTIEGLAAETDEFFAALLGERLETMPGLFDLLAALESAALPKAVATSSARAFTREVLAKFDLRARFQFVLTAEDVRQGKPHPEIYQLAARRFGIEPRRMLVLEDSQNGCRAAVASGALAVAVPGRYSLHHDFAGAALVADSLADPRLLGLLQLGAGN
jgi:HAD superfamily hydrolase (TIGR01509 family)